MQGKPKQMAADERRETEIQTKFVCFRCPVFTLLCIRAILFKVTLILLADVEGVKIGYG